MFKVKYKEWKNYSGPYIKGTTKFNLKEDSDHWNRVVWLTSQVEGGGKFGTVMSYDGSGMTAGLNGCIAVYPRELSHEDNNPKDDQGPLWSLLQYIKDDCSELTKELEEELKECGWEFEGGHVWKLGTSTLVNGQILREELTPNQGKVPKFGEHWQSAKSWALLFHNIFADPRSFKSQIRFGIDHAHKIARRKANILRGDTVEDLIYRGNVRDTDSFFLGSSIDLAMSFFFSNAVNAPAMAYRKLKQSIILFQKDLQNFTSWTNPPDRIEFSRILIKMLGKTDFARWNFKIPNGRYQRTRKAAMKIWPRSFFEGEYEIMPRRL